MQVWSPTYSLKQKNGKTIFLDIFYIWNNYIPNNRKDTRMV